MVKLKPTELIDTKPLKCPEHNSNEIATLNYYYNYSGKAELISSKFNKVRHKSRIELPSDERNTRNPAEDDRCVLCIDVVASKYNENSHKRWS